jgi:hypothetical protein
MGGHNPAESVDSLQRNEWSQCGGIRTHLGSASSCQNVDILHVSDQDHGSGVGYKVLMETLQNQIGG